jgi:hypothetical protein
MRASSIAIVLVAAASPLVFAACTEEVEEQGSTTSSSAASTTSSGVGGAGGGGSTSSTGGTMDAGPDVDNGMFSDKYPAKHPTPPRVVWYGGATLKAPVFHPIYFTNTGTPVADKTTDFLNKVGPTNYWKANTTEYGVGPGTTVAAQTLAEAAPNKITDKTISTWLADKLNSNDPAFGTPEQDAIYVLVYPSTTTIQQTGGGQSASSCVEFGGYHSDVVLDAAHNSQMVAYAVIPQCSNFDGFSGIDAVTAGLSHELIEAATDPYPMDAPAYAGIDPQHYYWSFALGGETGDMCAQSLSSFGPSAEVGGYVVQRSWSNKAAAAGKDPCVPQDQALSYFQSAPVLPDMIPLNLGQVVKVQGVRIPVGQTRDIEVDLYSDGPVAKPWNVEAFDLSAAQGGPAELDFNWDRTKGLNGEKLHLSISALKSSQFGASLFFIHSFSGNQETYWVGLVGNK